MSTVARFWDWRRGGASPEDASAATVMERLEPVEFFTLSAIVVGSITSEDRRLLDILNASHSLAVADATSTSLLTGVPGSHGPGWSWIDADDILIAMPPDRASPRELKVHRRQRRVRIRIGSFEVVGEAHILPGVGLDAYVLSSRMRFLAITDASVRSAVDPAWERRARVVLVNVRPGADLHEMVAIS